MKRKKYVSDEYFSVFSCFSQNCLLLVCWVLLFERLQNVDLQPRRLTILGNVLDNFECQDLVPDGRHMHGSEEQINEKKRRKGRC